VNKEEVITAVLIFVNIFDMLIMQVGTNEYGWLFLAIGVCSTTPACFLFLLQQFFANKFLLTLSPTYDKLFSEHFYGRF
jgi:hypothetical protein